MLPVCMVPFTYVSPQNVAGGNKSSATGLVSSDKTWVRY